VIEIKDNLIRSISSMISVRRTKKLLITTLASPAIQYNLNEHADIIKKKSTDLYRAEIQLYS